MSRPEDMVHTFNSSPVHPIPMMLEATSEALWDMKQLMNQRFLLLLLAESVELLGDHLYDVHRFDAKSQLPNAGKPMYSSKSSRCS